MKKTLAILLAFLLLCMLSACGGGSKAPEPAQEAETEPAAATELRTLQVGYAPLLGCSLWFIAQELGYFNDYGLDLDMILYSSNADHIAAIQSGQLFCGQTGGTASYAAMAQGTDLSIWGGQMHEGSGIICQPEDVEIYKDFANYKGKKIGLVRMSTGDVVFRYGLIKAGLSIGYEGDNADVTIVELDSAGTITEAVKKGEVDCGGSWIPNLKNAEAQGLAVAKLSGEVIVNHP